MFYIDNFTRRVGMLCEKWLNFERNFNAVKFIDTVKPKFGYHLLIIIPYNFGFVQYF